MLIYCLAGYSSSPQVLRFLEKRGMRQVHCQVRCQGDYCSRVCRRAPRFYAYAFLNGMEAQLSRKHTLGYTELAVVRLTAAVPAPSSQDRTEMTPKAMSSFRQDVLDSPYSFHHSYVQFSGH